MSKIVQEKYQVDYNRVPEGTETGWVTDRSARAKKGTPGREGKGWDYSSRYEVNDFLFNSTPPGSDLTDQEMSDVRVMPEAGCMGTGSQITEDVTPMSLRKGYDRKKLLGTDDQYTREHNDAFYDVVSDEDGEGFLERNNMLDRM